MDETHAVKRSSTWSAASGAAISSGAATNGCCSIPIVAAKKQPSSEPGKIEITITHADRPVYPEDGITKQDIADYFEAVSGAMLKTLAGRPLGLQHWQKGIHAPGFFHQNIGKEAQ